MHIVQVQFDQALVQVFNPGVTHGRQNAAQVRVAGKKSCFDQWRMRNGIGHQAALFVRAAAFHLHGDELGRTLAIAHDGVRQLAGHLHQTLHQGLTIGAVE